MDGRFGGIYQFADRLSHGVFHIESGGENSKNIGHARYASDVYEFPASNDSACFADVEQRFDKQFYRHDRT